MSAEVGGLAPLLAAGRTWHRFVSPHYDDIALSCGGTATLLAEAGLAPEVAIVFGEEPDPTQPLTDFARTLHERWGLAAHEVVAQRRREEVVAAEVLGVTVSFLPFRDAIYRGGRYQGNEQLFGAIDPAEAGLSAGIASAMALDTPPDPAVRIYAPLAVGRHVDHQHAFACGRELARAGWEVWFYEDLPYALVEGALEARLGEIGDGFAVAATIDIGGVWERKLSAVLAYRSQLDSVFHAVGGDGGAASVDRLLRAYAARVGGGATVERWWQTAGGEPAG